MTLHLDAYQGIVHDLNRLRKSSVDVFGADSHRFQLHPTLSEGELHKFESDHGVQLPKDYRIFLQHVGRGGAGPAYGIFDLGEMDEGFSHRNWTEGAGFIGFLRKPFPYSEPWNDLKGMPDEALIETDSEEYDLQWKAFEERYFGPLDGAVPICHLGCALRQWLIVSGVEAGHVWGDDRAEQGGLYPITRDGSDRVTFFSWYRDWLDEAIAMSKMQAE